MICSTIIIAVQIAVSVTWGAPTWHKLWSNIYVDEAKLSNELFYTKLLDGKDISIVVQEIQQKFQDLGKGENVICGISSQGYKAFSRKLGKR